ncbi:TetR/AcrR family transcriptional regulator [Demequina sp. NBRC 110057]|uniref:TetR/AcrR family transcriptional regulator n=1 Tax=Demequina sp. NBRC 110057 TaxID=1570346 RepID=UPI0009FFA6AC|nr:TetR/AcrR family transcriptional regulator [Demequina sp. NBRC 110057]
MTDATPRRRRDAELLEAIRESVRAELAEFGFAGVTFEGVARRAQTSKPVLYRRFSSRADMVIDAFIPHRFATPPAAVTGDLRTDLLALLNGMAARISPADVATMRGLIGEVDEAHIERVGALTFTHLEEWLRDVTDAAAAAGELGPTPVPAAALRVIVAVLRHELIFSRTSGTEPQFAAVVDGALVPMLRAVTAPPA